MAWVIDRFEEGIAVLEEITTQKAMQLPRKTLPCGAREGDVVDSVNGKWVVDRDTTKKRAASIRDRFNKLKKS